MKEISAKVGSFPEMYVKEAGVEMIIVVYLLGTASVLLSIWLLIKNWSEIRNLSVDKRVATLGAIFQLAVVGAGVVVAVEALRSSDNALDYQRQARTNQLFEEVNTDELFRTSFEIRKFLSLNYDPDYEPNLKNEDRLKKINTLLEDGEFDAKTIEFEEAMERLRRCADSNECSQRRVRGFICFLSDDFTRNSARSPQIQMDLSRFNFTYRLRDNMFDLQLYSCGWLHAGIDYICEKYSSC